MTLYQKPFENIVGKGENAGIQIVFSFSKNVFYASKKQLELFTHIYMYVVDSANAFL